MLSAHLRHPVLASQLLRIQRAIYLPIAPLQAWMTRTDEPVPFTGLDVGAMEPISPGHQWGAKLSCAWLRLAGEVPSGASDLVIMLRNTGEGLVHTPDGTPFAAVTTVRAVGEIPPAAGLWRSIEPVPVTDGRTEVLIDCGFNGMRMINVGTARFHGAYLADRDAGALGYFYDYLTLGLTADATPDAALAGELTRALTSSFTEFERGGAAAGRAALAPHLAGPGSKELTYTAIGHGHLDQAWLWPIRETKRKAVRTYVGALARLAKYPGYIYGTSQPQQLAWLKESHPEVFEQVRDAIGAGRIEMQGAFWVEPDTNLPSGESLIRQALYGRRFISQEFGVETPVCWLPDAFGYSGALPQILRGCGMPAFSTIKLSWNKVTVFPYRTFRWRGIDGSEVLVHMPPEGDYNSPAGPASLLTGLAKYPEKDLGTALLVYGSGDGGGGPNESHLELIEREHDLRGLPRVADGTARGFFERLATMPIAHEHTGELYLETHQGTYTTQARNKYFNRLIERLLHNTEALAAAGFAVPAPVAGPAAPAGAQRAGAGNPGTGEATWASTLDEIWREVLLYQFHDILPGSSITRVHEESVARYRIIRAQLGSWIRAQLATPDDAATSAATANGAVSATSAATATSGTGLQGTGLPGTGDAAGRPLAFANLTSFARAQYVQRHGTWYRADLAPYSSAPAAPVTGSFPELAAGPQSLSNGLITLTFSDRGAIVSARLADGTEMAGGALNELVLYLDKPEYPFNAWDIDSGYYRRPQLRLKPRSVRYFTDGPTAVRETAYRAGPARITQRVILTAGSPVVLCDTKANWHGAHRMLRANFHPAAFGDVAHCDIQFGHIDRVTTERDDTELAQFEVCAHKWLATGDGEAGFAVLSDSKYGYRAKNGLISLNLLRAPIFPDKQADRGRHRFRYAFMPYRSGELLPVIEAGYALNNPLLAAGIEFSPIAASANPAVIIETIKPGERGGVALRLYETLGRPATTSLTTSLPHSRAFITDMLEHRESETSLADLSFGPFEIKTIVLEPQIP